MKKVISCLILLAFLTISVFLSCKKEYSCEGCNQSNKPPIAIAGPDQVITLPTDSISLDGSTSSDSDGKISKWFWRKIEGPASFHIVTAASSKTIVSKLVAGVYQFELKVTDDKGLSAKDTIMITVDAIPTAKHSPIANAGRDTIITLPINSIILDGSASTDPDNDLTSYSWTKISGPSSFNFANSNAVTTQVENLVQGIYLFELKVTDAGGLFNSDTVQVTVNDQSQQVACDNSNRPIVNAQLIPIGTLSQARSGMAVASAGNKILFAGGIKGGASGVRPASRVDIYDLTTNTWSTAELCVERYIIAAVANGNKIFFGGGEYGDGTSPVDSVDIYDVSTNAWTVSHVSTAGHSIAAATVGNKILFAGGDDGFNGTPGINRATQVDIYDLTTATWSTAQLSEFKRGHLSAVTANNKVYFAGGEAWEPDPYNPGYNRWYPSNRIDIYDNATNSWTTSFMQEGKLDFAGLAASEKVYWAGGVAGSPPNTYSSCALEIMDVKTGNSSKEYLFKPGNWYIDEGQNAVVKDNKIIFYRPNATTDRNKFDIYDIQTNTLSIGALAQSIPQGASIISVNNTIYIAGGNVNGTLSNQLYKLDF